MKSKNIRIADKEFLELISKYDKGKGRRFVYQKIAKHVGCSEKTIQNICCKKGWNATIKPISGKGRVFDWEEIIKLKKAGMSGKETAKKIGCSQPVVSSVWMRAQLKESTTRYGIRQ